MKMPHMWLSIHSHFFSPLGPVVSLCINHHSRHEEISLMEFVLIYVSRDTELEGGLTGYLFSKIIVLVSPLKCVSSPTKGSWPDFQNILNVVQCRLKTGGFPGVFQVFSIRL